MATVVKQEKFNTNNSWGFGGGVYTRTTYSNGLVIDKGKLCYRHLPPSPFTRSMVEIDGELVNLKPTVKDPSQLKKIFRHPDVHSAVNASDIEEAKRLFRRHMPHNVSVDNIDQVYEHQL